MLMAVLDAVELLTSVAMMIVPATPVGRVSIKWPLDDHWPGPFRAAGGFAAEVVRTTLKRLAELVCTAASSAEALVMSAAAPTQVRLEKSVSAGRVSKVMRPLPLGPTETAPVFVVINKMSAKNVLAEMKRWNFMIKLHMA